MRILAIDNAAPASNAPPHMRNTLPEAQVHPAIRSVIATYGQERIAEVQALTAAHRVVIVGMAQNVFPKRARKFLDEKGVPYEYLGIGSYLSEWRPRLELKLWTGWSTFPMIFLDGVLIGGFADLVKLSEERRTHARLGQPARRLSANAASVVGRSCARRGRGGGAKARAASPRDR